MPNNNEFRDESDAFTGAKEEVFEFVDASFSRECFKGNDKKKSGNNATRYVLSLFDYENVDPEVVLTIYALLEVHVLTIIEK
ncbi:hypothetical protein OPAG_00701 [Rhodococcus opacus PD630]|nr:hypothetical protein OPAG_00701 [Rhodococcus opacus PD630]